MFTGIIQGMGRLTAVKRLQHTLRLVIKSDDQLRKWQCKIGDSVAVNGVCLTIVEKNQDSFAVDVIPETLQRTNLGSLALGTQVDLEPALLASGRLDGHVVQGHIDTTAEILERRFQQDSLVMTFKIGQPFHRYIVEKGAIAIDGVSLTVSAKTATSFSVSLIPYTLSHTILGGLQKGAIVNIETDILGKYILNQREGATTKSVAKVRLPTHYGSFSLEAFDTQDGKEPALFVTKGSIEKGKPLLLRIHSECLTGDVFSSERCDCGDQLAASLQMIERAGHGAVLYLRQEGRGIGLVNKLRAYKLEEQGLDTVDANISLGFAPDERKYDQAAALLHQYGVTEVMLITNNPDKINQLQALGIHVLKRVPLETQVLPDNRDYLKTKKHRFHHILKEVD